MKTFREGVPMRRWSCAFTLLLLACPPVFARLTPASPEFQANDFQAGQQSQPDVAVAPSGEFVIIWSSEGQDAEGRGIVARRFTSLGEPIGAEFPVNSTTAGDQFNPGVAMDGSGGFVMT